MAKLNLSIAHAGMNSGATVLARMVRTSEIKTDPEIAAIFEIKAGPVVIWKGKNIVVDGHTRLKASIGAGIAEIPVEEKEFASLEEAKRYTKKRQIDRRNLSQAEIYQAAAELLARDLGISTATVQHARTVAASAPPEVIEQVKQNKLTINQAYNLARKKTPKTEAAEFKKIPVQIHKSSIQIIHESHLAKDAFRELLSRLHTLEATGEIAAPVYQDTTALLKPVLGADFLNSLLNESSNMTNANETVGDDFES